MSGAPTRQASSTTSPNASLRLGTTTTAAEAMCAATSAGLEPPGQVDAVADGQLLRPSLQ